MNMTWDYIAGFFDADGTVGNGIYDNNPSVRASFTNTNKEVLEKIQEFLGYGNLYECKLSEKNPKWKTAWLLCIRDHRLVKEFLETVLDKLIVKKEKSIETLEFIDNAGYRKGVNDLDHDEVLIKYNELQSLRKTGKVFETSARTIHRIVKMYR